MPDKPSPLLPDDEQSRDRLRAALTLCCVLALVLAGTVIPAVSGAGLGQTPLGSAIPTPNVDVGGMNGGGGGSAGGGLGALNPGDQSSVGGSLAEDGNAFRSRNSEVHFRVRSTSASYWRTGAYDSYTGSGWERSGDRRPYSGPIEGAGIRGERVEYRVTLGQSATSLPSVWRANSVSQSATDSLFVTDQRAFVTGDPVPAGTTYTGVSHRPARDPNLLRTAGRDYPSEIERGYTDLPEDTDRRVGEFTDDLTSDADSPYETATRIESWLEANKNYSLNVSEPSGDDVASQFIFDMEKGYCEYFATSMTVMLRSQGIPARYVVGYSTGQKTGANTYTVRAMNAHAWVEAYFPEVGWVRFDPTPGQDRLQSERQAYRNQTDASASEYDHSESGSPGEEFSPTESDSPTDSGNGTVTPDDSETSGDSETGTGPATTSSGETGTPDDSGDRTEDGTTETSTGDRETPGETTTTDGSPSDDEDSPASESRYEVELNRTPVPGATVEVTVAPPDNATIVVGAPVFFNGERVGVTDESGTVTARVPYAERLQIRVGSRNATSAVAGPPTDSNTIFSLSDPPPTAAANPPRSVAPGNETNGTDDTDYSLATNATLAVSGDVATGSEVVVTATVRGVPVRNADVTLGNEPVGTTDENGRLRVRLPDSPGNVTLAVSRGPVEGQTTLAVPTLEVSTDPALPLALPGTSLEVRATYGGDPLSDARVRVGSENLRTDIDGSATASLPVQRSAAVVVSAKGQTRRTTVSGLFVNLAGVLGGAALVLGGLGFGASRRGIGPRTLVAALLGAIRAVPALAVAALFGAADRLSWAVETVLDAFRELRAGETTVRELLDGFRAWLADRLEPVRNRGPRSLAGFGGGPQPAVPGSAEDTDDSYRTLRETWHTFLSAVSVRRPDAMTPGELADHAVGEDDLPPGAVLTLRDAFRDVEYGARSPGDRVPRVEEAIEVIERARRQQAESGKRTESGEQTEPDERTDSAEQPDSADRSETPDVAGGDD
jgi:transglutaminase-like putative cysteine protease